jgi:hypothetical protein
LREFLRANKGRSIVIFSHFNPIFEMIQFEREGFNLVISTSDYFYNRYDDLVLSGKYDIPFWFCGHSHGVFDRVFGSTRIVRNPIGYDITKTKVDFESIYEI